jgi:type IV pilus assembly protein PilA
MQKIKKQRGLALSSSKGFTLIEILIVIGIIAVLAGIVLIAVNPARQFAQTRDAQRASNLNAILSAIGQRIADHQGIFNGTTTIGGFTGTCGILPTSTPLEITSAQASSPTAPNSPQLGCLVPGYIPALPFDPSAGDATNTAYKIIQDANTGRITVSAPTPEPSITRSTSIEITR